MRRLWPTFVGSQAVSYEQALELFSLRCRSRNLSHHSLDWYKFLLGGFTRFLEANGSPSPRETTPISGPTWTICASGGYRPSR